MRLLAARMSSRAGSSPRRRRRAGVAAASPRRVAAHRPCPRFRTHGLGRPRNKLAHACWQTVGLLAASLGLYAVFRAHNVANAPNLYTAHGIIGLLVYVVFAAQWAAGFAAFLLQKGGPSLRAALMPLHRSAGVALPALAVAAVTSGVAEKQAWMGCNYYHGGDASRGKVSLRAPDSNPLAHARLLPAGCRYGLGCAVATAAGAFLLLVGALAVSAREDAAAPAYARVAQTEMVEREP